MNPGRGWNPNLEESYLLEYSESEDETWRQCTLGFYLKVSCEILHPKEILPMKVSTPNTSEILRYR